MDTILNCNGHNTGAQMDKVLATTRALNCSNTCVMFAIDRDYISSIWQHFFLKKLQKLFHRKAMLLANKKGSHLNWNCKLKLKLNTIDLKNNVQSFQWIFTKHIMSISNFTKQEIYKKIVWNVEGETPPKEMCSEKSSSRKCRKKESEPKRGILSRESDL